MQEYYINNLLRIKDEHLKVSRVVTIENVMDIHNYISHKGITHVRNASQKHVRFMIIG
jgi:hypothetical protein